MSTNRHSPRLERRAKTEPPATGLAGAIGARVRSVGNFIELDFVHFAERSEGSEFAVEDIGQLTEQGQAMHELETAAQVDQRVTGHGTFEVGFVAHQILARERRRRRLT